MKKTKILYGIEESVDSIKEYLLKGNDFPKTSLWMDFMELYTDYEIVFIEKRKSKGLIKIFEKLLMLRSLQYQIDIIRERKKYDIIFFSLDNFYFLVILLRYFKLFKKPIVAFSHYSFNHKISSEKWYWILRWRVLSFFTINGVDKLAFMNENALNKCSEIYQLKSNCKNILHWGPDLEFYDKNERVLDDQNYFMSIGSSNRDYDLLINAFKTSNYKLKILQFQNNFKRLDDNIPGNIIFEDQLISNNLNRHEQIRAAYKGSFAVLISLEKEYDNLTGITCLFEAMACKKPVIVTDNVLYPFDVEKEGVGLKVAYGDLTGWINAINYLAQNKDIAKEMGNRGYEIIKSRYNYNIYINELMALIKSIK